ncbi:right-handed parallel beta-helix repeat-containing protein [bacterium]|nr:right-handed parallel beta-helix repeat-containing protein [bacterium]
MDYCDYLTFMRVWLTTVLVFQSFTMATAERLPVTGSDFNDVARSARRGDTLVLSAGVHRGTFTLPAGIALDGMGAILEGDSGMSAVLVLEGSNDVRDLTVRADPADSPAVGIRILKGPANLRGVHVRGFRRYGIRAGENGGTFVDGSVEDCGEDGFSAAGSRWTIQRSRFARNGDDGVDLFKNTSSIIASCLFDRNGDAAVELGVCRDVRLIGNTTLGHRVTCSARLGDLPSRFSNNSIADSSFLEKRGDMPVSDWAELERRYPNAGNGPLDVEAGKTPEPAPVEVNIVVQEPASPAGTAAAFVPPKFAGRLRERVTANLSYGGLQASDLAMKTALPGDTFISPLLRKVFDDPLNLSDWLETRSADGARDLSERYRAYAADLGMEGISEADTFDLSTRNPESFGQSLIDAWKTVDAAYWKSFDGIDSPTEFARGLRDDLEAQYAEEAQLGLPLMEDFLFDIEMDIKLRDILRDAARVDSGALFQSAENLMALVRPAEAAAKELKSRLTAKQLSKPILHRRETPWGPLVIAGVGDDRHETVTGFLIDLGGNDRYEIPEDRPARLIIDLSGNDQYIGAAAKGVEGLSAVCDSEGDDRYEGPARSLGAGLLGCGVLIDRDGDDHYDAGRYSQGFGFFGVGWLEDGGGDDVYRIPGYGQGMGAVWGLGVISDASGNDRYEILPVNNDPIRNPARTTSMGQGLGEGLRPRGAGGIGVIWDGGGRDEYLADLFAQGVGYWYGFGALIDVGEANDQYTGYHYTQGAGIHLSVGALYDGGGADRYQAWYVSQGCGHDVSLGAVFDIGGDDIYSAFGLAQGAGSVNGIGLLCDFSGRDAYMGTARMTGQGDAWYHARLREYGSLGLFFDLGGEDFYASGSLNRSIWTKGEYGLGVDE